MTGLRLPAHIHRVFRLYALAVRALYLSAVTLAPLLVICWYLVVAPPWQIQLRELPAYLVFVLFTTLIHMVGSAAAWRRLLRHEPMLANDMLRARPLAALLASVSAAIGTSAVVAFAQWKFLPGALDFEGNAVSCAIAALVLYAIALLTGELRLAYRPPAPAH